MTAIARQGQRDGFVQAVDIIRSYRARRPQPRLCLAIVGAGDGPFDASTQANVQRLDVVKGSFPDHDQTSPVVTIEGPSATTFVINDTEAAVMHDGALMFSRRLDGHGRSASVLVESEVRDWVRGAMTAASRLFPSRNQDQGPPDVAIAGGLVNLQYMTWQACRVEKGPRRYSDFVAVDPARLIGPLPPLRLTSRLEFDHASIAGDFVALLGGGGLS